MTTIQPSFGDDEATGKRKRTRLEMLLAEMARWVPWRALLTPIAPYSQSMGRPGRQPHPLNPSATILRIHFLQQCYALSGPAMERALYSAPQMRRFARLCDVNDIPDKTHLNVHRLLKTHGPARESFERVNTSLARKGHSLRAGTIMDATFIAAASSTKNADGECDQQMHRTKKGNRWLFAMKAYIGADDKSWLAQSVDTVANECSYRLGWRN